MIVFSLKLYVTVLIINVITVDMLPNQLQRPDFASTRNTDIW